MKLSTLNPWNWFKHEENTQQASHIPLNRLNEKRYSTEEQMPMSTFHGVDSLVRFHREFEKIFDDVWTGFGLSSPVISSNRGSQLLARPNVGSLLGGFRAHLDVSGDDRQYKIQLDVPGLTESELSIDVHDRVLTIRGSHEVNQESDDKQYYRVERSYGAFRRTLCIPDDGDTNEICAALKNGVLTLTVPRREIEKQSVKKIAVSVK